MSILTGLDGLFDQCLGVASIGTKAPHHGNRTSALRLSTGRPPGFDAGRLLGEAYARLVENLRRAPRFAASGPSAENWRFERQLSMAAHNASLETQLERAIAASAGNEWANQVPTASGLWDSTADKRRAVDLVRRRDDGSIELIELKVESDTPLRAAVEIVQYGLLYLLAREHYPESARARKELLSARGVHLRVLAPADYYPRYSLGWLGAELDVALARLFAQQLGDSFLASFAFEAFSAGFRWPCPEAVLLDSLHRRMPVWAKQRSAVAG